jgi:hypothetical protein
MTVQSFPSGGASYYSKNNVLLAIPMMGREIPPQTTPFWVVGVDFGI